MNCEIQIRSFCFSRMIFESIWFSESAAAKAVRCAWGQLPVGYLLERDVFRNKFSSHSSRSLLWSSSARLHRTGISASLVISTKEEFSHEPEGFWCRSRSIIQLWLMVYYGSEFGRSFIIRPCMHDISRSLIIYTHAAHTSCWWSSLTEVHHVPRIEMSARDQVESLLALIKEAAFNALDEYEKTGQPTPTLDSLSKHPLDDAEDKLRLKKIISKLEGACEQLCTTLAPPTHTIMNVCAEISVMLSIMTDSLRE